MTATDVHDRLNRTILDCDACPRLRDHCLTVARKKRAAFRDETYHGLPVPNFGDPAARLLVVGLAPAAHGANRTGRMFTGDRSGDFLYRAMHAVGLANQPTSDRPGDGLALRDVMITAVNHCAPPGNKPTRQEMANCEPFLERTFAGLPNLRAVLSLGKIGHDAVLRLAKRWGRIDRLAAMPFGHGEAHELPSSAMPPVESAGDLAIRPLTLLCSYHPSQQNTFTGRLTDEMLREVFERSWEAARA